MKELNNGIFSSLRLTCCSSIVILFAVITCLQADIPLKVYGTNQIEVNDSASSPSVEIYEPESGSAIILNDFWVNGTSKPDNIEKIEVLVQKYPFDDVYDYKDATPISQNNWSMWSYHAQINGSGYYMIQVHIVDESGNENWTETSISVPFLHPVDNETASKTKIALVDPTFTSSDLRP